MVSFGTRHTLSSLDDPERGIGAALDWGKTEFEEASAACGGCLDVSFVEREMSGRRIPEPVLIRNAIAIQRGSERPNEVVIIQGHIDSRASDVMDATSEAPGANDNASGSALVLEAARALSQNDYPTTIVYALLMGEEQGLYGGNLLADYATEQGWTVKAVLNNDVVGGSCGSDGVCDAEHVRVFSEGVRADAEEELRAAIRSRGGANDSPSRNLSRFLDQLADGDAGGLDVRQTWRSDRMGRGGDHLPFLDHGYPAIRFSVAIEDYEHQHQNLRTEDGTVYGDTVDEMDFNYLAKVTQLNVRALDRLAHTPAAPAPTAEAVVRTDTLLEWRAVPGADHYHVYQRRTDQPYWNETATKVEIVQPASGADTFSAVVDVRGDDWFFGVNACSATGHCSPVASAVPAGAFAPVAQPEDDSAQ